ncbi:unnamed protein product [Bemisia tabaci]|uniref:C2H2-type domain-containing protein n=1 Tax=Bemisia tabaci TaxID=7038 RepID=A0A9P0AKB7_BEMTA|nr:unnamed protein product [Bemisia tabaci]
MDLCECAVWMQVKPVKEDMTFTLCDNASESTESSLTPYEHPDLSLIIEDIEMSVASIKSEPETRSDGMDPDFTSGVHFLTDESESLKREVKDEVPDLQQQKRELLEYLIQEDNTVICKWCGEVLPSRTHWYRHKYKFHVSSPGNLYKCHKCNAFFKSKKGYMGHVNTRHWKPEDNGKAKSDVLKLKIVDCNLEGGLTEYKIVNNMELSPKALKRVKSNFENIVNPSVIDEDYEKQKVKYEKEYEKQRQKEEQLVADIIDRVRKECEAQGSTVSRRGYSRRSTVMNSILFSVGVFIQDHEDSSSTLVHHLLISTPFNYLFSRIYVKTYFYPVKMKRKSVGSVNTPSKVKKEDKEIKTPKVKVKVEVEVATPENPVKAASVTKTSTKKKNGLSPKPTPTKLVKTPLKAPKSNGKVILSQSENELPKGQKKKHLIVEKKSDKDLFSLNGMSEDLDVVENIDEEEFLESSSEDESEKSGKSDDSLAGEEEEEEDDDENSETDEDSESDELVDEKLIADDSSDEEAETDTKKKDFGFSSLLISSSEYIKKKKFEKYISKQGINITRCINVYSNKFLVCCETREQAKSLMAPGVKLQIKEMPLTVSRLPFYVVLENLPNYISADDVKKAVASCIEQNTIKNIIFLHINKCIVEFTTEQAFEKFTKKVTKLNVSGKMVRLTSWLDKLIYEYSARCIKVTHLPPKATVEILFRKLLEYGIKSKEIYQIKFFTRSVCSVFFESEETEQKLLALDGKMQFERGPVFMNLSTPKVVLLGLPQKVSEKSVKASLKSHKIDPSKIHSKVLELDNALEIGGVAMKILPLAVSRKNYITLGLFKLNPSVTKADVLKALADEGHNFDEDELNFEFSEKNSVKLSELTKLKIGGSSIKVTFCKFGSRHPNDCGQKRKRVQKKKKKKKSNKNKKQKTDAAESG